MSKDVPSVLGITWGLQDSTYILVHSREEKQRNIKGISIREDASDNNTHVGRATSFSAAIDVTRLYLYTENSLSQALNVVYCACNKL